MVWMVPYEAEFECAKGHRFKANVGPFDTRTWARCTQCYEEWVAANTLMAVQITEPVRAKEEFGSTMD